MNRIADLFTAVTTTLTVTASTVHPIPAWPPHLEKARALIHAKVHARSDAATSERSKSAP